jgi:hypothetical protein
MGSPVHDLAVRKQSVRCLGMDIETLERARDVEPYEWLKHGINPTIPTCHDGAACCHSVASSAEPVRADVRAARSLRPYARRR